MVKKQKQKKNKHGFQICFLGVLPDKTKRRQGEVLKIKKNDTKKII